MIDTVLPCEEAFSFCLILQHNQDSEGLSSPPVMVCGLLQRSELHSSQCRWEVPNFLGWSVV